MKRYIKFSMAFFLFVVVLIIAFFMVDQSFEPQIERQTDLEQKFLLLDFFKNHEEITSEDFQKELLEAIKDLKIEAETEKESFNDVLQQLENVIHSMDVQIEKLKEFIEEIRFQFNLDDEDLSEAVKK